MLAEDRMLLARVARLNQTLGEVTVRLLGELDPDEPIPPTVLRELAGHIDLLAVQLRARADAIAATVDEDDEPVFRPLGVEQTRADECQHKHTNHVGSPREC